MLITFNIEPIEFPPTAPFTLQVETNRTEVVQGEGVGFSYVPGSMTGVEGFNNIYRDLQFETDLNNPLGTVETFTPPKGNSSMRRIDAPDGHVAYMTPGTKTITMTAYSTGKVAHAQGTATVNVVSLDSVAWDVVIYHRPSGDFTGIPADGAVVNGYTVRRTQTWTQVRSWSSLWSGGDNVRIILEDNANMNIDSVGECTLEGNAQSLIVIHNESMGAAGTHQTWTATAWGSGAIVFGSGDSATTRAGRIVVIGLDFELGGNPRTGENLEWTIFFHRQIDEVGGQNEYISFTESYARGFYSGFSSGGNSQGITAEAHLFFQGCDWGYHFDYCVAMFAGRNWTGINACSFLPDPFTSTGDAKVSNDPNNWMPDHSLSFRLHTSYVGSCVNSYLGGGSDWFGTNEPDMGMQECCRWVPLDYGLPEPPRMSMVDCWGTSGRGFLIVHRAGDALGVPVEPDHLLVDRCVFVTGRHARIFANVECGTVFVRNSITYLSEAYSDALGSWDFWFIRLAQVQHSDPVGQSYVDNVTVFSDRGPSGGGTNYVPVLATDNRNTGQVTFSGMAIHVPGHSNAASYPSPGNFSRGNLFKPLSGNAVIDAIAVNEYRPVVDFEGRTSPATGNTANAGAYQSVAQSDPGVPNFVNTVAPTVSRLTNSAGNFVLIDPGQWTGIGDGPLGRLEEYLWHPRWTQGANTRDGDDGTVFKENLYPGTGNISVELSRFNVDGDKVSVASSNFVAS